MHFLYSTDLQPHDISAAFDAIDPNILITNLQHYFNISSTVLKVLSFFTLDLFQTLITSYSHSPPVSLKSDILKGIIMKSTLFLIYYSTASNIPDHFYATNTDIYLYLSTKQITGSLKFEYFVKDRFCSTVSNELLC